MSEGRRERAGPRPPLPPLCAHEMPPVLLSGSLAVKYREKLATSSAFAKHRSQSLSWHVPTAALSLLLSLSLSLLALALALDVSSEL